ncbi:MAG: hypothetical protein NUV46_01010 [Nanoarchaeota archaeon]|nr:hypothetical protein [Nanoarchaeota archaeon]
MIKKGGFLDISFSWIFAFLVGAIILFVAIYFVTQFGEGKTNQSSAESGTKLLNLLLPLETGVESGKSVSITFPVKTRINHFCQVSGTFGKESISIQEFIRNKWTLSGVNISSEGEYLFFPKTIEGKEFFAFSMSYESPFKIANLIYITDADKFYCFSGAPLNIEEELQNFNNEKFKFDSCSGENEWIQVCFSGGSNCDIEVNVNRKEVKKDDKIYYFEGNSLMYAAIFSDKEVYECEIQRLMKRGVKLSEIYQEKSLNLRSVGCESDLASEFAGLQNTFSSVRDSEDLTSLASVSNEMNNVNRFSRCTLW